MSGIDVTASPAPVRNDYLLLQKIADAFGRMEELTPLSIMMQESASTPVYRWPLGVYLFPNEKRPKPSLNKFFQ